MSLKSFRRVRTDREDVKQLQDAVANSLQTIVDKEILNGQMLEGVVLSSAGITQVEHKLSRKLRGYFVVKKSANATVWDSASNLPEKYLDLHTSNNVTISLWVF